MGKPTLQARILDYFGGCMIIHLFLWAALTPWFFLRLDYSMDQYVTWMIEAPLIGLVTNYPLYRLITWFEPRWRILIRYSKDKP
jgi:hypothetical protein